MKEVKIQMALESLEKLAAAGGCASGDLSYYQAIGLFAIAERLDRIVLELKLMQRDNEEA